MIRRIFSLFLAILVLSLSLIAAAQDTSGPGFGGPNAVENQIEDDVVSWDGFRQNLIDKYGLTVSADYTAVLLSANQTFSDDTGAGGIARVYGT